MKGAFDKLAEIRPMLAKEPEAARHEDEFLKEADLVSVRRQVAESRIENGIGGNGGDNPWASVATGPGLVLPGAGKTAGTGGHGDGYAGAGKNWALPWAIGLI